jgi:pyruvate formate-lyase activating enzyme-like uncharacterized protein
MLTEITNDNQSKLHNPKLRDYAKIYTKIYTDFMKQMEAQGLKVDPVDPEPEAEAIRARLRQTGAIVRNDDTSVYINDISPACVACQTGIGSATFFVSLQCPRSCYYCFNPNQEEYAFYRNHTRDLVQELKDLRTSGMQVSHLALTGGEPLMHKPDAMAFYQTAGKLFPDAHTRLYTCGDLVDAPTLEGLRDSGLDEIRFSIRMHDSPRMRERVLERIALAKEYIPSVMVEMPVIPGTLETMQQLLLKLDEIHIRSINLLELCFPLINAEVFQRKRFKLKPHPYRVLYNYWYAGGLPVSRSEIECLHLMEFALQKNLKMGVHYCSLENKHTGQVYQQNAFAQTPPTAYFSQRDFFLKSAKVFGMDIRRAERVLKRSGCHDYQINTKHDYLEFHPSRVHDLASLDIEVAISSNILETRGEAQYMREVKLEATTPQKFDFMVDL